MKTKRELLILFELRHIRLRSAIASPNFDVIDGPLYFAIRLTESGVLSVHHLADTIDAIRPLHQCDVTRMKDGWLIRNLGDRENQILVLDDCFHTSQQFEDASKEVANVVETTLVRKERLFVGEQINFGKSRFTLLSSDRGVCVLLDSKEIFTIR